MKWPHGSFKIKWNDSMNEPEVDQAEFGNFRVTYNPDDSRFYVSRRTTDASRQDDTWPYDVLATYQGTQKGHENAVQRMKREVRAEADIEH